MKEREKKTTNPRKKINCNKHNSHFFKKVRQLVCVCVCVCKALGGVLISKPIAGLQMERGTKTIYDLKSPLLPSTTQEDCPELLATGGGQR